MAAEGTALSQPLCSWVVPGIAGWPGTLPGATSAHGLGEGWVGLHHPAGALLTLQQGSWLGLAQGPDSGRSCPRGCPSLLLPALRQKADITCYAHPYTSPGGPWGPHFISRRAWRLSRVCHCVKGDGPYFGPHPHPRACHPGPCLLVHTPPPSCRGLRSPPWPQDHRVSPGRKLLGWSL